MAQPADGVLERVELEARAPAPSARSNALVRALASRAARLDVLCAVLAISYALPSLFYPHGNDQSLHWYVGQGILRGELPFVAAISAKPVGIFVVHALSSLLFGPGQIAIRLADLVTLCVCTFLVAEISRPRAEPARPGALGLSAIVSFGVYYTYFDYWDLSHPELWEGTLALAATLVASGEGDLRRRAFWVGVLSTLSPMFKHTAVVLTLPIALYLAGRAIGRKPEQRVAAVVEVALPYALGALAVVAACVLPYVFTGSLHAMWEVLFTAVVRYAGKAPGPQGIPDWFCLEYGGSVLIATGIALAVGRVLSQRRGLQDDVDRSLLLLGMTVAAIGSVVLQYRFYTYHFVVAAPWLAASMVFGLRVLWPARPVRRIELAFALFALAFAIGPWWRTSRMYSYREHMANVAAYLAGSKSRWDYLEPFTGQNRLDTYRVLESIGQDIKRRARPGDTLCVRGFAPPIYQVSGLRCPSRHVVEARSPLPGWHDEYEELLSRKPPTFVVTFSDRPDDVADLRRRGYVSLPSPKYFEVMKRVPHVIKRRSPGHRRERELRARGAASDAPQPQEQPTPTPARP